MFLKLMHEVFINIPYLRAWIQKDNFRRLATSIIFGDSDFLEI